MTLNATLYKPINDVLNRIKRLRYSRAIGCKTNNFTINLLRVQIKPIATVLRAYLRLKLVLLTETKDPYTILDRIDGILATLRSNAVFVICVLYLCHFLLSLLLILLFFFDVVHDLYKSRTSSNC